MARRNASSPSDRRPLYQQAAKALAEILANTPQGQSLPSEPTLAKQLGVSRATLREAMRTFEERGLVIRRQGVGTYVTKPPKVIETGLEVLESLETLAARIGLQVDMGALTVIETTAGQAEATLFGGEAGVPVLEVSRVISAGGRPVAYLVDRLPGEVLAAESLRSGFRGSVLDLLLKRGEPALGYSRTEITAVSASPEIARRMKIQRGDVLLCFEASLCTPAGRVVDHSFSYFLPGTFRFHVVRRVGQPASAGRG